MNLQAALALGAVAAVVASSIASIVFLRRRGNPREKERRRRELVHSSGRVIEGYVTGCENGVVHYTYHWRGVRYEASQDISDLEPKPTHFEDFSGPVTVKFLGSRPSNSMVVSENWSGFPQARRVNL